MGENKPKLIVPRSEAEDKIRRQIEKREELLDSTVTSERELDDLRESFKLWDDFNSSLLQSLFEMNQVSRDYDYAGLRAFILPSTLRDRIDDVRKDIREKVLRLKSVLNRLSLIEEVGPTPRASGQIQCGNSRRVFIVHGARINLAESLARYLEKLELEAIILHEQNDKGKLLLEKFEEYADAAFAVVLLTADDVCGRADDEKPDEKRARQNVVFELGFFFGRLTRRQVCVVFEKGVTKPSDIDGLVYKPLTDGDQWKLDVAKEIKAAGVEIDFNRLM